MTEYRDPGMIEHAPSCHLQHGLGGQCNCGASDRALVDSSTFSTPTPRLGHAQGRAIAEAEERRERAEAIAADPAFVTFPLGDALDNDPHPWEDADARHWPEQTPGGSRRWKPRWGHERATIPTPQLDEARRREDERVRLAELIHGAGGEAIAALHAKIGEEDARARSLLPDPPDGWEWEAQLQTEAVGAHVLGEVVVRIVYRLREVTP